MNPQAAMQYAGKQTEVAPDIGRAMEGTVMDDMTRHVRRCFEMAQNAKSRTTERLLACERQRRGVYDPDKLMDIKRSGGSDIFMMLTDIKCRAAEAWIKDVLLNVQDKSWSLQHTPLPDLPEFIRQDIIETIVAETMQVQQMGMPVDPESINLRMDEIYTEVNAAIAKKAKEAAERMEKKIEDILEEANFNDTYGDVINDFVTYPTAILKGPMVRKKKGLSWGANFEPQVTQHYMRDFSRVSPYDAFPAPNATGCHDDFFIERTRLQRKDMQSMLGAPGNNDEAIKAVLDLYGKNGLKNWQMGDSEREHLEGKENTFQSVGLIECIEFWGAVPGSSLIEWGMKGVSHYEDYECNVWVIGPYTVRAVINADPLGRRPYEIASFVKIPGAFWGMALPELMRDVQTMCNAAARSLANNMSIASGPQVEVSVDRLPTGENVSQIYPWKIWQTQSDKSGGGQPAIRFFQPNMNAEALMGVYQYFQRVADEVTGVPNYIYGSSSVSGAGRTASGLSMLMENAAKGIKHAILALDRGMKGMLGRLFEHLMIYDPDQSIKGDMKILARGAVATIVKESIMERQQAFLQATANPIDAPLMGPQMRASVIRDTAKTLNIDITHMQTPEQIGQQMAQQQMQQQQMMQQQMAQQQMAQEPPMGGGQPGLADGGMVGGSDEQMLAAMESQLAQLESRIGSV